LVAKAENELEKSDEEYKDEQLFELSLEDTSRKRKKQPKDVGIFRSKTSRLRSGLVFAVMRVLTPNFRKAILDWQTLTNRTPRPFTLFLKKHFGGRHICGAEIGFGYGYNASSLLEELNIVWLFCVDPMKPYTNEFGEISVDYCNARKSLYRKVTKDSKVSFIRLPSDKAFASETLPRGDLDFVYVDGLHTPDQAYRDIMNALDFVKVGGVVGGHDFTRRYEHLVFPAVFRVAAETGLVPTVKMPDFWFIKAENWLK
jgi:hypothetical protein